jgi:small-conductance mechanosensitive channel
MEKAIQNAMKLLDDPAISKLAGTLIAVVIVVAIVQVIKRVATRYIEDKSVRYRARKAIGFIGYLLGALVVLAMFSDRLGRMSVVFGVAGAGIAFALQEVIVSVAGWAAVSFGSFYTVGDRIQLGGIKGDVIDIGVLRTTLAEVGQWVDGDLYNGRMVRVANSFVFKEPVVNYSGDFPFLWDEITVPIRFGSDLDMAQAALTEAANEVCGAYAEQATTIWARMQRRFPLEDASTVPMVTFGFDENWVKFTIRYTVQFDRRRATKHLLSARVLKAIESSGGAISVAAAAIELFPKAPLDIRQLATQD